MSGIGEALVISLEALQKIHLLYAQVLPNGFWVLGILYPMVDVTSNPIMVQLVKKACMRDFVKSLGEIK